MGCRVDSTWKTNPAGMTVPARDYRAVRSCKMSANSEETIARAQGTSGCLVAGRGWVKALGRREVVHGSDHCPVARTVGQECIAEHIERTEGILSSWRRRHICSSTG